MVDVEPQALVLAGGVAPDGSALVEVLAPKREARSYQQIGRPTGVAFATENVPAKYADGWNVRSGSPIRRGCDGRNTKRRGPGFVTGHRRLLTSKLQANLRAQCHRSPPQPRDVPRPVNEVFRGKIDYSTYARLFFSECDDAARPMAAISRAPPGVTLTPGRREFDAECPAVRQLRPPAGPAAPGRSSA